MGQPLTRLKYDGTNSEEIYAFLVEAFGYGMRDWMDKLSDGSLAIMGDDSLILLPRGAFISVRDNQIQVS